ncbi:hypothetical protein V8C42DRAFT_311998 [Trichoderma barbatum]
MATDERFVGKVISITGAARGIGLATARYLAKRGAILAISDILRTELKEATESLKAEFPNSTVQSTVVDITDAAQVQQWIEGIKSTFGKLDGSVNNAGVAPKSLAPLKDLRREDWDQVIGINLTGTFICMQAELNAMGPGASIVNISSVSGVYGGPGVPAYIASKHGILGLTKAVAYESAALGIRVNAVCPGFTDTAIVDLFDKLSGGLFSKPENLPQLDKRVASPDEIAPTIAHLLSDEAKFITKSVVAVDGGFMG